MSIYVLSRSEMYWKKNTRVSAIADTMNRTRWKEIKSKIHFSRNLEANTNNSVATDVTQKCEHRKPLLPESHKVKLL